MFWVLWQKIEDSTQCKTDKVEIDLGEFKELRAIYYDAWASV